MFKLIIGIAIVLLILALLLTLIYFENPQREENSGSNLLRYTITAVILYSLYKIKR